MKKIYFMIVALLVSLNILVLSGCDNENDDVDDLSNQEIFSYKVKVEQSRGGTISVDKSEAKTGEIVNISVSLDDGYYLESLTYNNLNVRYNFVMPAEEVLIKGTFAKIEEHNKVYDVIVDCSQGGQASTNFIKVEAGTEIVIETIPNEGFVVDYIEINGEVVNQNTFIMSDKNAYIYVSFVKDTTVFEVSAQNSRYGKVMVNRNECYSGGTLIVDYIPVTGYILDYFTINGKNVGNNLKLTMPDENVIVSAVFKKAIEETPVTITSEMSNGSATSYWYFNYNETGLDITVKVEDPLLIMTGDPHYRDYVECVLDVSPSQAEWNVGKTVKLTVTADGLCFMRRAVTNTAFGKEIFDFNKSLWSGTSSIKKISEKDGYSGYEVKFHISYDLFGMDYASCLNKIVVMPAMNNSESLYAGKWVAYSNANWFNMFTYLAIKSNGEI